MDICLPQSFLKNQIEIRKHMIWYIFYKKNILDTEIKHDLESIDIRKSEKSQTSFVITTLEPDICFYKSESWCYLLSRYRIFPFRIEVWQKIKKNSIFHLADKWKQLWLILILIRIFEVFLVEFKFVWKWRKVRSLSSFFTTVFNTVTSAFITPCSMAHRLPGTLYIILGWSRKYLSNQKNVELYMFEYN